MDLEFHHYKTLNLVFKQYVAEHNIPVSTDEEVLAMRDDFYKARWDEVVTDGVTLTAEKHKELHKLYGREPALSTADKQKHWVKRMKEKHEGKDPHLIQDAESGNRFSRHIPRTRVDFASLI